MHNANTIIAFTTSLFPFAYVKADALIIVIVYHYKNSFTECDYCLHKTARKSLHIIIIDNNI